MTPESELTIRLAGGCQFALCDGSVRMISYSIDEDTHRRLGDRKDSEPVDGSKF